MPPAPGISIVLTIDRRASDHTGCCRSREARHGVERRRRTDEVARHHQVQLGPDRNAVRIESVVRQPLRMLGDDLAVTIEFDDAAGMMPFCPAHHRHEKSAVGQRVELIGDRRLRRIRRRQEAGTRRPRHVEEEDLVLSLEDAEEAAGRQRPAVARQADVMRLVAARARAGNRYGPDDLAVALRIGVEVDDGQEIRTDPFLIAGPEKRCRSFPRAEGAPCWIVARAIDAGYPRSRVDATHLADHDTHPSGEILTAPFKTLQIFIKV